MHILIVGGGIAGLNCALRLLRKGHRVTVAEKKRGPIDKVCGEGILPFGVALLDELAMSVPLREAGHAFHGISYHLGSKKVSARFPEGRFGIGIERKEMDRLFREACSRFSGFELWEGVQVRPDHTSGFDRVIAADGIHSRWSGLHGCRKVHGKRLGMRFRLDVSASDMVAIHFFKPCEVYMTPTDAHTLSVAFLIDPDRLRIPGGRLKAWSRAFFQERFPALAKAPIREVATRGPIASRPKGPIPPCHVLGDAYRAFDPISGAGMSFALLCGKLAAEHLENPAGYYRALKPALASIKEVTNTILFFRGGGLKTRLMLRQLSKAPHTFEKILELPDGRHRITDLGFTGLLSFLKPF